MSLWVYLENAVWQKIEKLFRVTLNSIYNYQIK